MPCHPVKGYFSHIGYGITFIEPSHSHFFVEVSKQLFLHTVLPNRNNF